MRASGRISLSEEMPGPENAVERNTDQSVRFVRNPFAVEKVLTAEQRAGSDLPSFLDIHQYTKDGGAGVNYFVLRAGREVSGMFWKNLFTILSEHVEIVPMRDAIAHIDSSKLFYESKQDSASDFLSLMNVSPKAVPVQEGIEEFVQEAGIIIEEFIPGPQGAEGSWRMVEEGNSAVTSSQEDVFARVITRVEDLLSNDQETLEPLVNSATLAHASRDDRETIWSIRRRSNLEAHVEYLTREEQRNASNIRAIITASDLQLSNEERKAWIQEHGRESDTQEQSNPIVEVIRRRALQRVQEQASSSARILPEPTAELDMSWAEVRSVAEEDGDFVSDQVVSVDERERFERSSKSSFHPGEPVRPRTPSISSEESHAPPARTRHSSGETGLESLSGRTAPKKWTEYWAAMKLWRKRNKSVVASHELLDTPSSRTGLKSSTPGTGETKKVKKVIQYQ